MSSAIKLQLPCPSRADVDVGRYTTLGVGGRTPLLVEPRTFDELKGAVRILRAEGLAFRMLGGGANVVIDDAGLDEILVLPTAVNFMQRDGEGTQRLRLAAGLPIPTFVNRTREMGLTGAECLVGIPGTMGGATAMNAGGRHGWLSSIVKRVRLLTKDGEDVELDATEGMFAYRSSNLGDAIVLETIVELQPGDRARIQDAIKTILKEKSAAQPLTQKSAGCAFKNPPHGSAGKLLEAAGVKGLRRGGAEISTKHANFVLNLGGATYADVIGLMLEARRRVFETSGVTLEREVKVWSRSPDPFAT